MKVLNEIYVIFFSNYFSDSPHLQDSLTTPIISTEGRSILLTCVVRELGNHTLLWKYGSDKVLTANTVRITHDTRFSVLHDKGKCIFSLFEHLSISCQNILNRSV